MIKRNIKRSLKPSNGARARTDLPFNIISSYVLGNTTAHSISNGYATGESGISYSDEGAKIDGAIGSKITLNDGLNLTGIDECTVLIKVRVLAVSDNHGLFSDKDSVNWGNSEGLSVNIRLDGGVLLKVGTSETYTTTDYFNDQNEHNLICRYKNGSLSTIHVDGNEISYDLQSTGAAYVKSTKKLLIGTYYTGDAAYTANAIISHTIVIDKMLSVAESLAYSNDINKLLVPRKTFISSLYSISDTTAPIISNPTGSATGSTTATGTFDTDETVGTGYAWATTNATEIDTDIIASGNSAAVSATTTTITHNGLTAGTTYYIHYVQNDAAGNTSNVISSASFVTDAASTFQATWATRARASRMIGAR